MSDSTLTMTKGSTKPIRLEFLDQNDGPEDLSSVDAATFVVRTHVGAVTAVLERSIQAGDLSVSGSALVATLSSAEADALPVGAYVGEAAVRFGDGDSWFMTEPITVDVVAAVATKVGP